MMILDIDPKVDYAFKRVYGRDENRDVLASVLEAVLAGTEFGTITDLEIRNPFNDRNTANDRLSIVDVRARQKSGELFNVEMQLLPFKELPKRLLYYWSVSYAEQLDKGQSYTELKPTILICFADHVVFSRRTDWHTRFRVVDGEGRVLCPDLEIHILELPKFPADPKMVVTPLEQWLFFLRKAEEIDSDHVPPCLTLPAIHKAIEELHMISLSEADHELYLDRRKFWLDEQSRREEGFLSGIAVGRIQLLQSQLGLEETPAEQLDALAMDDLRRLEAELKAKLANRS
jgi:predicted transposase/invertase (TIGR01784 family)